MYRNSSRGNVVTLSGRSISYPPAIRIETNRKAIIDSVKLEKWLLMQGRDEAIARGDDYFLILVQNEKEGRLSQATKDFINQYLFGKENLAM